jgi:hypothetical protein
MLTDDRRLSMAGERKGFVYPYEANITQSFVQMLVVGTSE